MPVDNCHEWCLLVAVQEHTGEHGNIQRTQNLPEAARASGRNMPDCLTLGFSQGARVGRKFSHVKLPGCGPLLWQLGWLSCYSSPKNSSPLPGTSFSQDTHAEKPGSCAHSPIHISIHSSTNPSPTHFFTCILISPALEGSRPAQSLGVYAVGPQEAEEALEDREK